MTAALQTFFLLLQIGISAAAVRSIARSLSRSFLAFLTQAVRIKLRRRRRVLEGIGALLVASRRRRRRPRKISDFLAFVCLAPEDLEGRRGRGRSDLS